MMMNDMLQNLTLLEILPICIATMLLAGGISLYYQPTLMVQEVDGTGTFFPKLKKQLALASPPPTTLHIGEILIYPIKSCGGVSLQTCQIESRGFEHDRRYLIIDRHNRFLSQRKIPSLALIQPSLVKSASDNKENEDDSTLVLSIAAVGDMPALTVPILRAASSDGCHHVSVWEDDEIEAIDQGDEVASWLTSYFESSAPTLSRLWRGCRLVRIRDGFFRETDRDYSPGYETGFADGFPYLITATSSLSRLNEKIHQAHDGQISPSLLTMKQFRPNIVIEGSEPFSEDMWLTLQMNQCIFYNVKPCGRCQMPGIDQETSERLPFYEPTKTLQLFRRGTLLGITKEGASQVYFGSNFVADVTPSLGTLSVGDAVHVLLKKE